MVNLNVASLLYRILSVMVQRRVPGWWEVTGLQRRKHTQTGGVPHPWFMEGTDRRHPGLARASSGPVILNPFRPSTTPCYKCFGMSYLDLHWVELQLSPPFVFIRNLGM